MRVTIIVLLSIGLFACSEEQQVVEEGIQESKETITDKDWPEVKIATQQVLQDIWDISKQESNELFEQSKEKSQQAWQSSEQQRTDLWQSGKDKSETLWLQGKSSTKEVWTDFESESKKVWSSGKEQLQDLLKEKQDPIDSYDEI